MLIFRLSEIFDNDTKDLRAAQHGDREAFARLVKRYEHMIIQIAYQYTANSTDAEDVAQETFLKAFRALHAFRSDCRFSSWLCRICINTARDLNRRNLRHPSQSMTVEDRDGEYTEMDIADTASDSDPALSLERLERIRTVRAAIRKLGGEHRLMLILRDMEGRSYEEIAEMTGLNPGTVKSRINRARQALKKILQDGNFL